LQKIIIVVELLHHVSYLPTQKEKKGAKARFSFSNANQTGKKCHQAAQTKRTAESHRLTMLKKSLRLGKRDLEGFFKAKSRFCPGNLLQMRFLPAAEATKWAFVVSSSVKKNAVARNLVRRRMAEIARDLGDQIKKNADLVFFLKLGEKKTPSYEKLKNDMIRILTICGFL